MKHGIKKKSTNKVKTSYSQSHVIIINLQIINIILLIN